MAGTRKHRVAVVGPAALALGLILALSGCGDDDEPTEARGATATTAPAPTTTGDIAPEPTTTTEPTATSTTEATGEPSPSPSTSTTPAPTPGGLALSQRCTVPGSFSVAYPEGWHTNSQPAPDLCAWFGPDPITVPEFGTDAALAPVNVRVQVRDLSVPTTGEAVEVERAVTVDGRPGVRRELRTTEDLLLPAGTRLTTWEVVVAQHPDGRSDVLTGVVIDGRTGPTSYGDAVAVLDAMMPTVDLDG